MKLVQQRENGFDLSSLSFADTVETCSFEELLDEGVLVNVTAWVQREMGFDPRGYRVRLALTARLWRSLNVIPPLARSWQTFHGRGYDLLWAASYALRKARRLGLELAQFQMFLPTDEDEEDQKMLRVACLTDEQGRRVVTIGYAEEC